MRWLVLILLAVGCDSRQDRRCVTDYKLLAIEDKALAARIASLEAEFGTADSMFEHCQEIEKTHREMREVLAYHEKVIEALVADKEKRILPRIVRRCK